MQPKNASSRFGVTGVEPLNFDRTIDRQLVHKQNVNEVLLTSGTLAGESSFLVGAQWPRRHHFMQSHDRCIDSALVAETLRQVTIYIAHRFYEVSLDARFLMDRMMFDRSRLKLPVPAGPWDVSTFVSATPIQRSNGSLTKLTVTATFYINTIPLAEGIGELRIVPSAAYRRVRYNTGQNTRATGQDNVDLTGRAFPPDFAHLWSVIPDTTDPGYFEHASDHVPGMFIMDSARRLGRLYFQDEALEMTRYDAQYSKFFEVEEMEFAVLDADHESCELTVAAFQNGRRGMSAESKFARITY